MIKKLINGKAANAQEKYHVLLGVFAFSLFALLVVIAQTHYTIVL